MSWGEELEFLREQIERHERSDPEFAEWLRGLRARLAQVSGARCQVPGE